MKSVIFIKTWKDDLPWLGYCLESIRKFGSGFENIILCADEDCRDFIEMFVHDAKTVFVDKWGNGYIQQQWFKLNADKYTNADLILFVDSDCVFHTPFSPESYMRDEKPILMKTRYGNLGGGEVWKKITEDFVGWEVEYEYMRRLPWMYRSSSLQGFRNMFPKLGEVLKGKPGRDFSEFNALGAYIDKFENDQYFITDTEVWIPDSVAKQFWSWGGITPEIRQEIKAMLS